ncbi:MAG TPA: EF-P beta-lysylation protein EpmB [Arenimonas sp.]|nr:EF-P beta-lysylation protein EpmB [Arenimonas sp.]
MITVKPHSPQMPSWQSLWRDSVQNPEELLELLGLQGFSDRISPHAQGQFALRVPRGFAAKMRMGDIDDPLLRQVLPLHDELLQVPGFDLDAVGDMAARQLPGVLHKYHGRALLVTTGSCAINCRYCFRRHFPYAQETAAANQWQQAIGYLAGDTAITELLLSGGDPLSLSTGKLRSLGDQLKPLAHIKRLRFHTRLPIVLPERIDVEFTDWLQSLPHQLVFVVHANHANELDGAVTSALGKLARTGATLLNQSVLLKGVNDSSDALAALSERLFDAGVLPYYLHQLDRVQGAAHFEVPPDRAKAILAELMARLPGYLVPKLVQEIAGQPNKTPVF